MYMHAQPYEHTEEMGPTDFKVEKKFIALWTLICEHPCKFDFKTSYMQASMNHEFD